MVLHTKSSAINLNTPDTEFSPGPRIWTNVTRQPSHDEAHGWQPAGDETSAATIYRYIDNIDITSL